MNSLTNLFRQLPGAKESWRAWPLGLGCRRQASSSVPLAFFKVANEDADTKKAPVLILHGLFGMKINFRSISNQLASKTKRVIFALDLRNHGDSPHVDGEHSNIAAMASDIGFFMERTYIEKACLLGHSLGGRIAFQYACSHPDKVEKLILVDVSPVNRLPPIDFLNEGLFDHCKQVVQELPPGIDISKARREVGTRLMSRIQNKFIVDFFLMNLYKDTDELVKWKFNVDALKTFIANREIDKVSNSRPYPGPSLIVYGQKSHYVRAEDFGDILELLPKVNFVPIADAGHYLHAQKTSEFIGHVVNFLKR